MGFVTQTLSRRPFYLAYVALLAIALAIALASLAVSSSLSHRTTSAVGRTPNHPHDTVRAQAPGTTSTVQTTTTAATIPPTSAPTIKGAPTTKGAATTTVAPKSTRATSVPPAGTVYLPVHPGSGAGCTAGITEGNRWIKYVVQRGDNLSEIARCFDLNGYEKLYQDNVHIIGSDPNLIYAGQVFTIVNGIMTAT